MPVSGQSALATSAVAANAARGQTRGLRDAPGLLAPMLTRVLGCGAAVVTGTGVAAQFTADGAGRATEHTGDLTHVVVLLLCIDPAVSAQVKLLKHKPQRGSSCSAPGEGAGGCRSRSSLR